MADSSGRSGLTVALTRSEADNVGLAQRLRELGMAPISLPMIEVVDAADGGAALRSAVAALDDYWLVTVTSANGVAALARALEAVFGDSDWPARTDLAVVGPATAAAATALGWPVSIMPSTATAAALVEAIPDASLNGIRVLAPLAQLASPTITEGLQAKGYQVDRVEAYRTQAPVSPTAAPDFDAGSIDVATFFSPSAVDRYAERFGPHGPTHVVAIGPSTLARAVERGFASIVTADPHTEDGVVAALENLAR